MRFLFLMITFFAACKYDPKPDPGKIFSDSTRKANSEIAPLREAYQESINGKQVDLYILKNGNGMQAAITNYGGRLVCLWVPDKNGKRTDVVAGFDRLTDVVRSTEPYFGAIIGRYGNRIAKGKFKLNGKKYSLFVNNGPNTLHGGKIGFQYIVWDANQPNDSTLQLLYLSKDGEEGFPGNLDVQVTYSLNRNNELRIDYSASTDKKTVVNLTNHAFFNLNGQGSGPVTGHLLMINADRYTPVDATLIPTGKIEPVENTAFDFRQPVAIGARIDSNIRQLKNGKGYDHNFVLNKNPEQGLITAATALGDQSGIFMEVLTEEPGLQFYSGNFMKGMNIMKGGKKDDYRTAFCLETQHFPDSPNHPNFPSTELEPGKKFETSSVYRFSVKK